MLINAGSFFLNQRNIDNFYDDFQYWSIFFR